MSLERKRSKKRDERSEIFSVILTNSKGRMIALPMASQFKEWKTMAPKSLFRIKLVVAFTLVTAILAFGARQFLPRMPLHELVLISIACWVIAMTVIGALVLGKIAFADFILRRGGTDVQWLSLGREPPGLERLRSKDQ